MFAGGGPGTSSLPSPCTPTQPVYTGAQASCLCRKMPGRHPPADWQGGLMGGQGPQVLGPLYIDPTTIFIIAKPGKRGLHPLFPGFFWRSAATVPAAGLKKIIKNFSEVNKQPIWIVKYNRGQSRWPIKNYRNAALIPGRGLELHGGFELAATDEHYRYLGMSHDLVGGMVRHVPLAPAVGGHANQVHYVIWA